MFSHSVLLAQTAQISIPLSHPISWDSLYASGLSQTHGYSGGQFFHRPAEAEDLILLDQFDVPYIVKTDDLSAYYQRTLPQPDANQRTACNGTHFQFGSMGGYHTYDEVVANLDLMRQLFPQWISDKFSIGTTYEGRDIWAVKLSDHPASDESSSEGVVYFDGLTHAREPMSMEVLLHYMWWLLEGADSHDEAAHLLQNREIFVVPVVNPDGYVYNETIAPNGGGVWRKNRRPINTNCVGVDLNRNFAHDWGHSAGASGNPCSQTFHGGIVASEAETQSVQALIDSIQPATAMSMHSHGQVIVYPPTIRDTSDAFATYATHTVDFISDNHLAFGTSNDVLSYFASGTTIDYLHGEGVQAWMPEIGTDMWEAFPNICVRSEEIRPALLYASWAAGAFPRIHTIQHSEAVPGDTLFLEVSLSNRGVHHTDNVLVQAKSLTDGVFQLGPFPQSPIQLTNHHHRTQRNWGFQYGVESDLPFLSDLAFEVVVLEGGTVSHRDTLRLLSGQRQLKRTEGFEAGRADWVPAANVAFWRLSDHLPAEGDFCLTDSPDRSYANNVNSTLSYLPGLDLRNLTHPFLEFMGRWSLQPHLDWVKLEVSPDNGGNWYSIGGEMMNGEMRFNGHQSWARHRIDLADFVGQELQLRLRMESNALVRSDGFYVDDIRLVEYADVRQSVSIETEPAAGLRMYPNPAVDLVQIEIPPHADQESRLAVVDALGKELFAESLPPSAGKSRYSLSIADWPSGWYLVRLQIGGQWYHQPLIK
ncbi:MAG: M14 family zinc carboxypeptidase [Bacteroidota bacterium]